MTFDPYEDGDARTQEILTELFGPLASRVRGRERPLGYLCLLFSLIFLRQRDASEWSRLRDDVRSALDEQWGPRELLRAISDRVGAALRAAGLPTDLAVSLTDLDSEAVEDVAHIVRLCEQLGVDAFHPLADRFQSWTQPEDEAFFTPRSVVRLMVDLLLEGADTHGLIHDPCLGSGEFLAGAMGLSPGLRLSGTSPSRDLVGLAGMRLHALGIPKVDLSVIPRPHQSGTTADQADLVLANPPFNSRRGHANQEMPGEGWFYGPPPPHNDNYAWLQHILMSLRPGGRAGVLMPNRAAVSTDAREVLIRRRMIEGGAVECVIALPRQLFAGTSAPAMIWMLRRPDGLPRGRAESILLIDARRFGFKTGKQRMLTDSELCSLAEGVRRWRSGERNLSDALDGRGEAGALSVAEIVERGYSLDPSDYLAERLSLSGREAGFLVPYPAAALEPQTRKAWSADDRVALITVEHQELNERGHVSDWRETRLAHLCQLQTGPSHSLVKKTGREAKGVRLVKPVHLRDHRISAEDPILLSFQSARALEKYQVQPGDVLIVRTGSVGPTALVTEADTGCVLSTNLIRLRPDDGVDPRFLLALLSSPTVQRWIEARSGSASAIPSISAATLGTLPVMLPPPDAQHRIGLAVDAFDAQITSLHALVRASRTTRAALADGLVNGLLKTTYALEGDS